MFKLLLRTASGDSWKDYPGPGPSQLIAGNEDAGYFGEVTQAELLSPAQLMVQLTELNRTASNPSSTWLKFIYNKKIIYVSKTPIVTGASWDQLYAAGLVYGTDDDGFVPATPPKNQLKIVAKDDWRFKARLIRNDLSDPSYLAVNISDTTVRNSEYTDLMYKMFSKVIENYPVKWASFTDAELGLSSGYELLRETQASAPTYSYMRGNSALISRLKYNNTFFNRIVLELIDNDVFLLRSVYASLKTPLLKPLGSVSASVEPNPDGLQPLRNGHQAVINALAPAVSTVRTTADDTSAVLPIIAKSVPVMGHANGNLTFSFS